MKQVEQTETLGFTAIQVDEPRHQHHGDRGGGDRVRTDDPLLAKQVLSQLSYAPWNSRLASAIRTPITQRPTTNDAVDKGRQRTIDRRDRSGLVGQGGFEPPTPRLSSVCSNQLSY